MRRSVYGSLAALTIVASLLGCGGSNSASAPPSSTPGISISTSAISFGNQLVNSTSSAQAVTITNTGNANLVIYGISVDGLQANEFKMTAPVLPITIVASSSVSIQFTFAPSARGGRTAKLTFSSTATSGSSTVSLNGTGVAPVVSVATPTVEFGTRAVSGSATTMPVVVSNTGDGDLVVSAVSVDGSNASDFQLNSATSLTIKPNASATMNVAFKPTTSGARTGGIVFTDNTSKTAHSVVSLSGTGMDDGPVQLADASVILNPHTVDAPSQYPSTFSLDIIGADTDFAAGATSANFGPGITVSDGTSTALPGELGLLNVTSTTNATAKVALDSSASPGSRSVLVTTGGHESLATFVVPPHNSGPVAQAGVQGYVAVGATVYLDGSGSTLRTTTSNTAEFRTDQASLSSPGISFHWKLVRAPEGSTAALTNEDSAQPSLVPDKPGTYVVELTVSDGSVSTTTWAIFSTENSAPVAYAGPNQFVSASDTVNLDGSASYDIDGDPLTYQWSLISSPSGSSAALANTTAVSPVFTVDVDGDYLFLLTVNDGHGNTASDTVLVSTTGSSPIAAASPAQKVSLNQTASLDGSASKDPDGQTITCTWMLLSKPASSNAQLSTSNPSACTVKPSFTVDQAGLYLAQLTVTDPDGHSAVTTASVSTEQLPPISDAGPAQSVSVGEAVELDGSKSVDPDGNPLTYLWSLLSKPSDSTASLSQRTSVHPAFVTDKNGDYVAQLVVSNLVSASTPKTVHISASSPGFQAEPTAVTFGNQNLNTTSDSFPIVITNTGSGNLVISQISLSGQNSAEFEYSSPILPITVASGSTATINVTFTPASAGPRNATLTLIHSAGGSAQIALSGTGAVPAIGIQPLSLSYPGQVLNTSSISKDVTIKNTGSGKLTITKLVLSGQNASEFSFSPNLVPIIVEGGTSTTISVTFKPSAIGTRSASLDITDNVAPGLHSVSLTGVGTSPAISASPNPVDFHSQLIGQTSSPVILTISNPGTADLVVTHLTITGTNPGDFAIAGTPVLPLTISAGQNTTIGLTFTPAATGNRTASLNLAHNGADSPLTIALGGAGSTAGITPTPSPVLFGDQLVGSPNAATQTLTLTNSGNAPLVINGLAITGTNSADFAFANNFVPPTSANPITVQPGSATTIPLAFKSTGEGIRSAVLSITGNASTTVNLSGTGTAPHIGISSTTVPFPSQQVDTASDSVTIVVTNTGTAPLSLSSVQLIGNNPGDFLLGAVTTPLVLTPGAATNLTVVFKPTALGSRSAQITIASNASDSPSFITLSGTGSGIPPLISPSSVPFNDQLVGTTSGASTVSINNPHSTTLTVLNVELVGSNPGDFAFTPATTSFTVPAQGNAALAVKFSPSTTGARAAILRITDNTGIHDVTLSGKGIAPGITLDPSSVVFGKQLISTSSQPFTVTITNPGTAPLLINNLGISGTNKSDFSVTAAATPFAIQPLQSATIAVTFTPHTATDESATLTITDNTTAGSHSLSLSGTGTAPTITVDPTTLNFGNQLKGTASNPSTVTFTNNGTGDLLISNLGITGPNATDFKFSANPTYPIKVAAGASSTAAIVFSPTGTGAEAATLTITSNAPQTTVSISGTSTVPQITLNPTTTLGFGTQLLNTASAVGNVTITNTGSADLSITNITLSGANAADFTFEHAFTFPIVVPANGSTVVGIIFAPKTLGVEMATLNISDNAAGNPHTLALTGTGVAPAILPLSPVNFGNVNVGATSSPISVTVTNSGSAPLHITSLTFGGANAGEFSTSTAIPIVVDPNNGTATIVVRFSPLAAGTRNGTLLLTDDAAGSPHSATLTGTAIGVPKFGVNPTTLDFGSLAIGVTSASQPLTITNSGTADLVIDHLVKTGANGDDFLYSVMGTHGNNDFPETITPGSSLIVNVSFKPTAGGARTANLVFQNAAGTSLGTVIVTGNGIAPVPSIALNPTALVFPNTPTNIASAPRGIVVTNNGTADLIISALGITGVNAADFSISQTAPITVAKGGGTTTLTITFKPTALGSRTGTLEITNNAGNALHKDTVNLSGTGQDLGRLNLQPATVGKDLELLAIGSVDVAPKSNLSITITSSDPSKLLLSPLSTDPTGTNAGVASFIGILPTGKGINGAGFPAFWIQSLASSGTVQITMTAPGYTSTSGTITLMPSGFVLVSPLGIGTNFETQLNAADTNLTLSTAQLDAGGNIVVTDQKLRGGTNTSIAIVSGTPATGTISGSPVSLAGGSSSSVVGTLKFHPVAIGTTQISVTQPTGFTTPVSGGQLTATVRAPAITLSPTLVGYNLQVLGAGSLNVAAPAGGLQVTISSSDTNKVLLSTDPSLAGNQSISVLVPAGSAALPAFYVQGLAASGTATLTASGSGYSSGVANVLLNPSGFQITSPNNGGSFVTTTLSSPTALDVSAWQLNSSLQRVTAGQIRGGISVPVEVVSGNTTTGTIIGGEVTFHSGDFTQSGILFQPNPNCTVPCTSVLSVSHTVDYATPTDGQITATVNKPAVNLRVIEKTIGGNLQVTGSGSLDVPAPTDLQVTITSNNPNVLLSASPTAVGSTTLTLTVFQGGGVNSIGFPSYYIQALGDSGSATLTISASGFDSSNLDVNLAPSGFVIEGLNNIGGNFGILLMNGSVDLTVRAAVLNPVTGLPTPVYQPVRGGFSAQVNVTSSATGVATLTGSPLQLTGGNVSGTVTLTPQAPGQTTITIITPTGFATPSFGNGFVVTVN